MPVPYGLAQLSKDQEEAKALPSTESEKDFLKNEDYEKFSNMVNEKMNYVLGNIKQRVTDPKEQDELVRTIFTKNLEQTIENVFELSDKIRIDELKRTDPSFTPASSYIRGASDIVTFGIANKAVDHMTDKIDRDRLLAKAYPSANAWGQGTGFIAPLVASFFTGGATGVGALAAFEAGAVSRKAMGSMAKKYIANGGKSQIAKMMEKAAVSQGFVQRAVDLGVGSATYETVREAVKIADESVQGVPTGDINQRLLDSAQYGAISGAVSSLGFDALGAGVSGVYKTGKGVNKLIRGSKLSGGMSKEFMIEHLDEMKRVVDETPEVVIATDSEKILNAAKKYEGKLATREEQIQKAIDDETLSFKSTVEKAQNNYKDSLVKDMVKRDQDFQKIGIDLSKEINAIKTAKAYEVADLSRVIYEKIGSGFRKINTEYGQQLDDMIAQRKIKGEPTSINTFDMLQRMKKTLVNEGAMTESGKFLDKSNFATLADSSGVYQSYKKFWNKLGGNTLSKGGNPGNISLEDFLDFKKEVGVNAGFSEVGGNNTSRLFKNLFHDFKAVSENQFKEIKNINENYANKRSKLDAFRDDAGKREKHLANFIENSSELKGTRVLARQHFEALSEISEDLALGVSQGLSLNEKVSIVQKFSTKPESIVSEIRRAYVNDEQALLQKLDQLADKYPKSRPYLQKAIQQGEMVKSLSDQTAINKAVTDMDFAAKLQATRPDLTPLVQEQTAIAQARKEFTDTFPLSPKGIENRVKSEKFGSTGSEREQMQKLISESPEVAGSFQNIDIAKQVEKELNAGPKKSAIESTIIPAVSAGIGAVSGYGVGGFLGGLVGGEAIGRAIFKIREKLTPKGQEFLNALNSASPKTQNNMMNAIFRNMKGTKDFPIEKLNQLIKVMGSDKAYQVYIENGGEEDFKNSLEEFSKDVTIVNQEE